MSDDGRFAVVVIALLGSPFSPWYARARSRGASQPLRHCALHVALHGPGGRHWSLRERAIDETARGHGELALGESRVGWRDGTLVVDVAETTTPGRRPLRGQVRLRPEGPGGEGRPLDARGDHRWWPVAPLAHAEVEFREPRLRFRGHGYADANAGRAPLDTAFASWSWSRARVGASRTAVAYDLVDPSGREDMRTLIFSATGRGGECADGDDPETSRIARTPLPTTSWGLPRRAKADAGTTARVVSALEDGPCYARALVGMRLLGNDVTAVHEVLSVDRLRQAWVRFLLGFRMGRSP